MISSEIWPALDYSRVPYRLYHDAAIYVREQERIFGGPVWSFLGLDSEIPNPGDFRAGYVGETPVIVNRDKSGAVKAFVNRCAHRGALVRRELYGHAEQHICIYHQWCYGLDGSLKAIPFRRGIRGKGGLDPSFEMRAHGLRPLRVVCHERAVCVRRCGTVREMKEGPSRPAVRCRSQATASCCRQERWW
jgi:anthranilate 1,2-dioxygenase large subunit